MDRFALKKRKKGPKSDNVATNSANPHVIWTPQAEAANDRITTSSWLAAPPLPRQNRGSQESQAAGYGPHTHPALVLQAKYFFEFAHGDSFCRHGLPREWMTRHPIPRALIESPVAPTAQLNRPEFPFR